MDDSNAQNVFLAACEAKLIALFEASKAGKNVDTDKHRMQGFMHAGEVLGLLSKAEGKQLIGELHLKVFGETVAVRAARKDMLNTLKEADPDAYFDIPAISRR